MIAYNQSSYGSSELCKIQNVCVEPKLLSILCFKILLKSIRMKSYSAISKRFGLKHQVVARFPSWSKQIYKNKNFKLEKIYSKMPKNFY